ncbi:MAG: integral membrane sensor signal transduction histidine kinase [Bacteroidetes bacterium]|nr:MAG: integral membrane sensor signal transduction histidine kinase [Bacteroidota bacterium]
MRETLRKIFRNRFILPLLALLCLALAYLLTGGPGENATPNLAPFKKELHRKEQRLHAEVDSLSRFSKGKTYTELFSKRPDYYNSLFAEEGIVLLIYENDTLKFWSDNSTAVENYMKEVCLDDRMAKLRNGWFEVIKNAQGSRIITGLLLVKHEYAYQNQYLINAFQEEYHLPDETKLQVNDPTSSNAVHTAAGDYLFSLVFKSADQPHALWRDWLNILLNLAGFILIVLFIRSECELLIPAIGAWWASLLFACTIILLRLLAIRVRFPESFYELKLFSPALYGDATSIWLPSLGDFLINTLLLFYLGWFISRRMRRSKYEIPAPKKITAAQFRISFSMALLLLTALMAWAINGMFSGLIQNSDISFNVNNIFSLNAYSYIGIIIMALLLFAFFIISNLVAEIMRKFGFTTGRMLLLCFAAAVLHTGITHLFGVRDLIDILWPFVIFALIIMAKHKDEGMYSFSVIVMLVFLFSFYSVHILLKQTHIKERDTRQVYAEKLAAEQDPVAEQLYTEFSEKLRYDTALIRTLGVLPQPDLSAFEKRIQQQYFSGYWEKYEVKISFFDTMCTPLIRSSTPGSENIAHYDEMIEQKGEVTISPDFHYIYSNSGKTSYLARIVLQKAGKETHLGQGTIFIELDSKFVSEETGFPELLLDREIGLSRRLVNYSYAKYKNGLLLNKYGDYQYNLSPDVFGKSSSTFVFRDMDGYNHLVHRPDPTTIVVLSKPDSGWLGKTTTFSYLFAFFSLLLIASLFGRQLFYSGLSLSNFSFKYRIQLVLVFIVLISLALFGGGTIYYIRQQYQEKNAEIISEKARSVLKEMENKVEAEQAFSNTYRDYASYLLKKFSNVFFTDINLYDLEGNLYASSRPKVFEEGLVSKKMNPEAYLQIGINHRTEFIHDENIGNLAYLSAYLPLKNKDGQLQAYLNLPYFAKQSDLQKEISTFLVALINVYVLLFALSILAAIFISNYLTQPLKLIQEKMRQVKLGKTNEQIDWKNRDEIGSLVSEYNRMIVELMNSAQLLAQSERESAWREMAKQVAHEIKNPLTPMRLSIQLLQQAYKDKKPDIEQRLERVTKTLIEQIDTLSSIASAFSDFAKMPKPSNEKIDLKDVVSSCIELFQETSGHTDFTFDAGKLETAFVWADREQLIRVFNNLLKNGLQAIPEDRKGEIHITLSKQKEQYIVTMKDNGTGISEDVIDKIFVPNFTTKTTGMGLGLAMVKNIVETAGGRIWFETTKGAGSTFFVALPEYKEQA